jgi:arylsulfatase A-like enzyme
VIDTLRADAARAMPRLGALAGRGAHFTQAITAATWTRPSLLAMLGGDLPTALGQGAEDMIPTDSARRRFYAGAPRLLTHRLSAAGRHAVAIGNNFFFLGHPQIGLDFGFDEVTDIRHPVLDTPAITEAAETFLHEHRAEPFFLYLHYDSPHWPYSPPPEYQARAARAMPPGFPSDSAGRAYVGETLYADDHLGRVLDALEREGLGDRTYVIVVGDHGEIFDHAHSYTVDAMHQPTLHHHGWTAYDEVVRVPWIVTGPGIAPREIDAQVSLVDFAPTLLELLHLPADPSRHGRSLAAALAGGRVAAEPAFVEGQNVRLVRAGGWAFLQRDDGNLTVGGKRRVLKEELYDLSHDPLEHEDRAANEPAKVTELRALVTKLAPALPDPPMPRLHLRVERSKAQEPIEGVLTSEGTLRVRAVEGGNAESIDAHRVRIHLGAENALELESDPPDARLTLELTRGHGALSARAILLGEFALPLVDSSGPLILDGERWSWADAAHPPHPSDRGALLLWRDPSRFAPGAVATDTHASDEVSGMMKRWGYAQPER